MVLYVKKTHVTFYVKKLIFFGLENIIYKLSSPISVSWSSFLKTFKKFAARALSNLKHSAIASCFKSW